jgi:2-amino-4-hydroxy-6-hydroxymethyldihydropteridine diphosphokinase
VSLILATGANIGNPVEQLHQARLMLASRFQFIAQSRIYRSKAQDYLDQPDFFNQVLEFQTPSITPLEALNQILHVEKLLGRRRDIPKGPRVIDIDILFFDELKFESEELQIPHPRLWHRSFVVKPLRELPYFDILKHQHIFPIDFADDAIPLTE